MFSYSHQPDNGLPILSWYDDKKDVELHKLYTLLTLLAKVKDVRPYISKIVQKDRICYDRVIKIFERRSEWTKALQALSSLYPVVHRAGEIQPKQARRIKKEYAEHNENVNMTTKNIEVEQPRSPEKVLKKTTDPYQSPPKKYTNTITLEENYSQTKRYEKGTIFWGAGTFQSQDSFKPTPNKSNAGGSKYASTEKPGKKAEVVQEANPMQRENKPTSVKVEQ